MSAQGHPLGDVESGKRVLVSPVTGTPFVVTRWIDKGDGKFVALEKREVDDRLFVPLQTRHFENFESGEKTWELRGINDQFNTDTVVEGRPVELRRGYSTNDSIWGIITEVRLFDDLTQIPERMDHESILPGSTWSEFMDSAEDLLGDYDHWIAFRVGGDVGGD